MSFWCWQADPAAFDRRQARGRPLAVSHLTPGSALVFTKHTCASCQSPSPTLSKKAGDVSMRRPLEDGISETRGWETGISIPKPTQLVYKSTQCFWQSHDSQHV